MKTEIRTIKSLSESEMKLMNHWMEKEFGKKYIRKFKEYYSSPEARCIFIKDNDEIIAFKIIGPVQAEYLGKKYNFFGMGDLVTIRRGQGYGRIIIGEMIKYLEKTGKTGIGFCARKNTPFYEKVGLESIKDFMKRFRYKNPKTGEISSEANGDGIFYAGDDLIKKILETNELVYLDTKLW